MDTLYFCSQPVQTGLFIFSDLMNIRIKKLDLLILRSFMGPFVVTFFVVLFAFTMQFYWLYMDELIGKGLGYG